MKVPLMTWNIIEWKFIIMSYVLGPACGGRKWVFVLLRLTIFLQISKLPAYKSIAKCFALSVLKYFLMRYNACNLYFI